MYLIKPGWKTRSMGMVPWEQVTGKMVLQHLESIARLCYKTEDKMTDDSYLSFMKRRMSGIIKHTAILDHLTITSEYICDRGVSHEWLRHKLTEILGAGIKEPTDDFKPMAVMQESTRYCNYMKNGGVCFVIPEWVKNIKEGEYDDEEIEGSSWFQSLPRKEKLWFEGKINSEYTYLELLKEGCTPQEARGDLAINVKTDFIVTCSLTEWRHIMKLRTDSAAHPDMKEIMRPQLKQFKEKIPILFDDIEY